MPSPNNDQSKILFDEFRSNALAARLGSAFYDEDDLMEIYNYAFDENDDFVKAEVINLAARLYPDNKEFLIRKVQFYQTLSLNDEAGKLAQSISLDTPHARLISLRAAAPGPDEVKAAILRIIDSAASLNEDDIIEMSEVAAENSLIPWLASIIDRFESKVEYKPTLYYELALNTLDLGELDTAEKMADMLVDADPMNPDFWEIYAEIALTAEKYDQALTGADYALAINPDNPRALDLKGRAMFYLKKKPADTAAILEKALYSGNTDISFQVPLMLSLLHADNADHGLKCLRHYLDNINLNRDVIVAVWVINPDEATPYLARFIESSAPLGNDYFTAWASELCIAGHIGFAARMLLLYDLATADDVKNPTFYDVMYELLYRSQHYTEIIDRIKNDDNHFFSAIAEIARLLSIYHTSGPQQALHEATVLGRSLASMNDSYFIVPCMDTLTRKYMLQAWIKRIVDALSADLKASPTSFDPFITSATMGN